MKTAGQITADMVEKASENALEKRSQDHTRKSQQLAEILEQCFDVLRTYGREPDSLENMHRAFMFVLDEYTPEQIQKAFVEYLKNSTDLPTPADIVALIPRPRKQVACDPIDLDYRKKMQKHEKNFKPVPWYGKGWDDLAENTKNELIVHIGHLAQENTERALGYIQYLRSHCGYPDLRSQIFAEV